MVPRSFTRMTCKMIPPEFFGTLTRNVPVSQLLKTLEATGHVHFIVEGNRITVMK